MDRDHPGGDGLMLLRVVQEVENEEHSPLAMDNGELFVAVGIVFAAFVVVLFLITARSILRSPYLSGKAQLVWIVGCFLAPVLVPTLWFTVGRAEVQRRSAPADA